MENEKTVKYTIDGLKYFDLAQTFECGQCFRFDRNGDGSWQGVAGNPGGGNHFGVFTQPFPDVLIIESDADSGDFWRDFLGLADDYAAIRKDISERFGGETIAKAMEAGKGIRILHQDPWEAVCSFIVSQNNNIPRIKKIIAALCESFGEPIETPYGTEYAFPTARALADAGEDAIFALRTGFRAGYIHDAACRVCDGRLDLAALEKADYASVMESLQTVKGIGPKVANCAALFGFGKFEAFPIDVWMKRIIAKYYPDGLDVSSLGPYAGIAQQYLFHYERNVNG